ncbi:thioredoxin-related transmembrane protein 1-like [Pectinophora gossypiella]|uniref:thioredoxin-related transmembrane protein 1-like n=1 Tax=Pectinophora gossypiella TaxID=13191 RepID=UPI00214ED5AF|nr:thioredoxin-related transmembrane protein 1-like [Pectinophora gossypiella]
MACAYRIPKFLQFFIIFTIISCSFSRLVSANVELDEDNWKQILDGEWMVEFYAPWCPACNALAPVWRDLSTQAARKSLAMRAAEVDVTKSPGLSGRFVVTALPTIFHVIDGEFRQYKGPRDVDSMLGFVQQKRWQQTEPVPAWKAPHSLQMTLVAEFFKLSQVLRSVHTMLMEQYGLPTWGSYLIFAIGTILIGALLGLLLVCIIDLLYPPRRSDKVLVSAAEARHRDLDGKGVDDEQELINDDIVDDNEKDSDAEKNSASDSSSSEAAPAAGGDVADDKPEVRKRRPRKAD